ncbi:CoA transferase [Yinghuangia sp. ASG 101]|uniref:CaiB/BaiF CoA transferase family protein n=1 Tax=Yinghuangia sp. ASG 101 TaxID=2896848 RepID=UPI001E54ECF6|nr:CoA transferase [Yinghuangia sp. ASG 101]UGQ11767.1 CoA transferase [Yinghuangia sp. ASG 101]
MSPAAGPLEGVRVVDWTIWQQGPVAGAMLGDLGADVIKIEERRGGDSGRAMLAFPDTGASPYFEVNNRNKRSIAVDLKKPEGVALVRGLASTADVFLQNFRPPVAEGLGLDYATLRADNPRLVYASASAFGPRGPERSARAYDFLGQARSGLLLRPGDEELGPPADGGLADQMGAIMLAYGVLAALVARERHGVGQQVDTSLLGSMLALRGLPLALSLMTQDGRRAQSPFAKHSAGAPVGRENPGNPLWNHYRCAGGGWIAMAMVQSDPHWANLLHALGRPEALTGDPRFADHVSRCENARACVAVLDGIFATAPRDAWLERLLAHGDMPITAVNTTEDVADDPQAVANEYVTWFDHPALGRVRMPGFPVTLSETPARIRRQAPEFGEHTEDILLNDLGLTWEDITGLRDREVIL